MTGTGSGREQIRATLSRHSEGGGRWLQNFGQVDPPWAVRGQWLAIIDLGYSILAPSFR